MYAYYLQYMTIIVVHEPFFNPITSSMMFYVTMIYINDFERHSVLVAV